MVGDLVWFAIAATGLAALAKTAATLFVAIKWAGVAYLLYLAYKLWTAPAERVEVDAADGRAARLARVHRQPDAHAGESQGHPVLPGVAAHGRRPDVAEPGALPGDLRGHVRGACRCVLGAYALLAARARELFTTPQAVRRLNRSSGVAMAGAAVVVATR